MTKPLRVGIAGLSSAATWALREILDLPYIQVSAAADHRQDALERFRQEFNAQVYTDVAAMCRDAEIDAVLVGTPPESRPEHTIIAAECGKHVIVEKPMALSVDEAARMNAAAEKHGIKLLCGHTHNFDPPITRMREIVRSGSLGGLCMINTWNFNEFIFRPNSARDLTVSRGLTFNQTIHQVDLVRLIGGGMVRSVRATVGKWEPARPFESGYVCHLEFENGVPATMVYGGQGFFDIAELLWGIGESGRPRDLEAGLRAREAFQKSDGGNREHLLEEMKEKVRYGPSGLKGGASHASWSANQDSGQAEKHQPFFGLTLVSCEKGDIRQSPDGLFIYSENGKMEIPLPPAIGQRQAEFFELYDAITHDRPVAHDGRWGQASLEACLAILQSADERREIQLSHQVAAVA
jgi:predicted dehydrogenase